jgi:starvation-inducible DNA-binding protein
VCSSDLHRSRRRDALLSAAERSLHDLAVDEGTELKDRPAGACGASNRCLIGDARRSRVTRPCNADRLPQRGGDAARAPRWTGRDCPSGGAMSTATRSARTFKTSVELDPKVRRGSVEILNQHLADAFDLGSQVKQAHWNVKGSDFWQLHKLFDEVAEHVDDWVDLLAERVTALGGYATGTVRMAASASSLPEFPTDITDSMDYVRAVADRMAAFTNSARSAIDATDEAGDANTADLFTEISRCADADLYFLEAHLS